MKGTLQKFWKFLGEITWIGGKKDLKKNGCKNTNDSSDNSSTQLIKNFKQRKRINMEEVKSEKKKSFDENQLYQWVKTEKAGGYVKIKDIVEEDGIEFVIFNDGSRANIMMMPQYLEKVDSEDDGYIFKEERIYDMKTAVGKDKKEYQVPGPNHGKIKKIKIPKKAALQEEQTKTKSNPKKNSNSQKELKKEKKQNSSDPIIVLLEKAKKQKETYDVSLSIETIPESLYSVISENFDGGEETTLEYLVSLIDMEVLKNELKNKIKEIYNQKDGE